MTYSLSSKVDAGSSLAGFNKIATDTASGELLSAGLNFTMRQENLLLRGIKTGVFLILLTPLVLGPFGLTFSAYPKAVFFRSLVEIVFILYLLLVFLNPRYLPKISTLVLTILFFIGTLVLTSFNGINFHRSFFGDPERAEGVISYLHLLAFFLILISVFNKEKEWFKILKITVIVSGISSFAGILQKLGFASFYGISLPNRISGTLSNPDFFAPYIVLTSFLGIFVLLSEKEKKWKNLWKLILILNCFTLILSGTRGAWIGMGIGITFLLCFWFFRYSDLKQKKRKKILFGFLILSIFALLIIPNQGKLGLEKSYFFQRFFGIFSPSSLGSRLDVWEISLNAWKEKPILGWGPESFSFVFDKYFKSDYLQYIPEAMYFDYPHNKVMELMAGTGLLGTLSYFSIFIVAFFYLFFRRAKSFNNALVSKIKGHKSSIINLTLAAFLISYFSQNLFIFDTVCTYLIFFLFLAFLNNNFLARSELKILEENKEPSRSKSPFFLKIVIVFLIFLSLITFYQVNYKPTVAAMAFPRSLDYEQTEPGKALLGYKQGINKNTIYDKDFRIVLIERLILILENNWANKDTEEEIIKTLSYLRPLLEKDLEKADRRPFDYYRYLARINEKIYLFSKDPKALAAMEEAAKKGLDFNDQKPPFYRLIGAVKILENNYEEGEEFFQKAFALTPGRFEDRTESHRRLAIAYFRAGDKPKAAEQFKKVLDRRYCYKKVILSLKKEKIPPKITQAEVSFAEAVAVLYCRELNDFETCQQIYEKTMEIYPEYKTILQYHLEALMKEKEPAR